MAVTREDPFTVWQLSIIGSFLFAAIIAAQCRCALQAAVVNVEIYPAAAEEAAENRHRWWEAPEKQPAGPEGPTDLRALVARISPCPFKTVSLFAGWLLWNRMAEGEDSRV